MLRKLGLLLISPLFLLAFQANAQTVANNFSRHNWFFGNSSDAIIFNKSDNEPNHVTVQGTPFGQGGSAVATDPLTGEVLFYTDGITIYDASHNIMQNGTALNGIGNTNQPAAICPVPNVDDQFYVFTNSASLTNPGTIEYTVVDMTQPGNAGMFQPNLGSVDNLQKNVISGVINSTEAMIIVPNPGLTACWLITQESGTTIYNVLPITNAGIGAMQQFNLGAAGALPMIAANFAVESDETKVNVKIAVSPLNSGRNVQVLDFNRGTGVLSFQQEIANTGNNDGGDYAVYDTEWSADGSKLYISRFGGAGPASGQLYQFDANVPNVQTLLPQAITHSLGLRLGPDGRIYHLYENSNGQFFIGRINLPNEVRDSVDYEVDPDELRNIGFNGRQFPEFAYARRMLDDQDFMWLPDPACTMNPVRFYPNVDPMGEEFSWNFNGEGSSNLLASSFTFDNPGPKSVQMRYFINGQPEDTTITINIQETDLMVQLQNDTICQGETSTLDATVMSNFGQPSYVWHDGSTAPTFSTDTAGVFWVVVSVGGCRSYSSAEVVICGEERQTSSVWYFGQNAGIDFNNPATAIAGSMDTPEGTATISDRNGNVIMYTDGESVWNREGNVMPNGTDIGGNRDASQSATILRDPEDETIFYIFTTEEIFDQSGNMSYKMGYAVVDIKEDNGLGDVVIKQKPLFEKSTERVAALEGANASWVVGHEYGTNTFRAYQVVPEGIANPVLSSVGSIHSTSNAADGEGYMAFSPAGDKLAVAIQGQNAVEIFSFADSTGVVDSVARVEFQQPPYGVAFSSSGSNLFVSTLNPSRIYRIKADTTFAAMESTTPLEVASSGPTLGAIQRGPDGQLYVARDGQDAIGRITNPDDSLASNVGFQENGFPLLGGTTSRLGLPNFAESNATSPPNPGMAIDGFCLQEPTTLIAIGPCGSLDRFEWTITPTGLPDSTVFTSVMEMDSITFAAPGLYDVNLKIFNCDPEPILDSIATIEISAPPVLDSIPAFLPLCNGAAEVSAASQDTVGLSYLWSTGETTRTITITDAGNYSVTVINAGGCVQSKDFLASPVNPLLDLGPDRIYCLNDQADSLNAGNPNSTFVWQVSRDGTLISQAGDTTRIYDVVTDTPGSYIYAVTVTDRVTACTTQDSVLVDVVGQPNATATPNDSPGCGAPNGSISIDVISTGDFTYNVTDGGGAVVLSDTITGPRQRTAAGFTAGVYEVTISDNITQCEEVISGVTIQDLGANFTYITDVTPTSCSEDDGIITIITSDPSIYPLTYNLILEDNNTSIFTGVTVAFENPLPLGPGFQILGLEPGRYSVEVTAGNGANAGCTISESNILVEVGADKVDLQTPEFVDACGTTADVPISSNTPGATFVISGPGGSVNNGTFFTVDTQGTYTFTASDPAAALCDSVRTVEVNITPAIQVQIDSAALDCSGSRALTATILNPLPNGTYTYQWYLGDFSDANRIPNAFTPQLNATESGNYFVRVGNSQAACVAEASAPGIVVIPPLVVDLSATTDCAGQSAIRITAEVNQDDVDIRWNDALGNPLSEFDGLFTINVNERGTFQASVSKSSSGIVCTEQAFIVLNDICPPQVFVHSAIRPDSDLPENRTFYVHNPNDLGDRFQVYIFNRWGEMIYESSDKNFQWNGTFKGEDVQVDTYPYLIRYTFADNVGGVLEKRGGVAVIR